MEPVVEFYPEREVDGIKGWHWINTDSGAWEGPKEDWETSHKQIILDHVNDFRGAIQVGGNCGMYPVLLHQMFMYVITAEPDPLNYQALRANVHENLASNDIPHYQVAVSDFVGRAQLLRRSMGNVGMHQLVSDTPVASIPVEVSTIDLIWAVQEATPPIDLLMVDVEGHELQVLKGATTIIEADKPLIFVENAGEDVQAYLKQFGYEVLCKSKMDTVFKCHF